MHRERQLCRGRLFSLAGIRFCVPVGGDGVYESLIVGLVLAPGDGGGLAVGLSDEFGSSHIGHPDLDGPEALLA